jgi:hypothetical protein
VHNHTLESDRGDPHPNLQSVISASGLADFNFVVVHLSVYVRLAEKHPLLRMQRERKRTKQEQHNHRQKNLLS